MSGSQRGAAIEMSEDGDSMKCQIDFMMVIMLCNTLLGGNNLSGGSFSEKGYALIVDSAQRGTEESTKEREKNSPQSL